MHKQPPPPPPPPPWPGTCFATEPSCYHVLICPRGAVCHRADSLSLRTYMHTCALMIFSAAGRHRARCVPWPQVWLTLPLGEPLAGLMWIEMHPHSTWSWYRSRSTVKKSALWFCLSLGTITQHIFLAFDLLLLIKIKFLPNSLL